MLVELSRNNRRASSQSDLGSSRIVLPAEACCGDVPSSTGHYLDITEDYIGKVPTPVGDIPRIATSITWRDRLEHWRVRWNLGRMRYAIAPGLYAVGNPTGESPVFVSANFKMSFDRLRGALSGRDGWIMVLDTKGINVWCAAGKGTFGTAEIVSRVAAARLAEVVSHRSLILPQLGAPGVKAHEVKRLTGFTVHYGPIRAGDLPAYLDSGMKATPEMRLVRFRLRDRLALVPVELISWGKWVIPIAAVLAIVSGFGDGGYSLDRAASVGLLVSAVLIMGLASGSILTPALLPWLPGRAFAAKGAWAGVLVLASVSAALFSSLGSTLDWADVTAAYMLALAVASFTAMNFTGASTYTSPSGVRKEMRVAVPIQIAAAAVGLMFWIEGRIV
ncbi:MAG: mercury methylation corrinoid protein HgcA [Candidatus Zixiibacteriota bacterium]